MHLELKRALRNGALLALVIAAIGLYQGEGILTAVMTFSFAWAIMTAALWLSYRLTRPKNSNESNN
jgi:hypothetical protein